MEQDVEFLAPVSNGYYYWHRVGEMGKNAKRQDGRENAADFNFKVDQTACSIIFVKSNVTLRNEDSREDNMLLPKLRIYLVISFTQHVSAGESFI